MILVGEKLVRVDTATALTLTHRTECPGSPGARHWPLAMADAIVSGPGQILEAALEMLGL